jgi:hypothetical protein
MSYKEKVIDPIFNGLFNSVDTGDSSHLMNISSNIPWSSWKEKAAVSLGMGQETADYVSGFHDRANRQWILDGIRNAQKVASNAEDYKYLSKNKREISDAYQQGYSLPGWVEEAQTRGLQQRFNKQDADGGITYTENGSPLGYQKFDGPVPQMAFSQSNNRWMPLEWFKNPTGEALAARTKYTEGENARRVKYEKDKGLMKW